MKSNYLEVIWRLQNKHQGPGSVKSLMLFSNKAQRLGVFDWFHWKLKTVETKGKPVSDIGIQHQADCKDLFSQFLSKNAVQA